MPTAAQGAPAWLSSELVHWIPERDVTVCNCSKEIIFFMSVKDSHVLKLKRALQGGGFSAMLGCLQQLFPANRTSSFYSVHRSSEN